MKVHKPDIYCPSCKAERDFYLDTYNDYRCTNCGTVESNRDWTFEFIPFLLYYGGLGILVYAATCYLL